MNHEHRWNLCIAHHDDDVEVFLNHYFVRSDRKALLVAGCGFDPRTCTVPILLSNVIQRNLKALFIQEKRAYSPQDQLDRSEENTEFLVSHLTNRQFIAPINIFGPDNAAIGGYNIIAFLRQQDLKDITDVIVDMSALSTGISFPIIRYFFELTGLGMGPKNLHVFVVHDPKLDDAIRSIDSEIPSYVRGFRGRSTLSDTTSTARLWLPQLATGRHAALDRL